MADADDFEIDPSIAEAMGFPAFGAQSKKKRKFKINDAFVDLKAPNSQSSDRGKQTSHASAANTTPIGSARSHPLPGGTTQAGAGAMTVPHEPSLVTVDTTLPKANPQAPSNLHGDDQQTLQALRNGVRNENGDMVYFMPSFLEDPWKDLRQR